MLDPERDLRGATPETLARALLRPLRRRPARQIRDNGKSAIVVFGNVQDAVDGNDSDDGA